jgi:hypothetical protein
MKTSRVITMAAALEKIDLAAARRALLRAG